MEKELKPCPFCGSTAEMTYFSDQLFGYAQYARVSCRVCGAKGPKFPKSIEYSAVDKAAEGWNRRASECECQST